jgi:hypothetical protein
MDYIVQIGDTLWGIATRLCGQSECWRVIAADNGLRTGSRLLVGMRLSIRDALISNGSTPPAGSAHPHAGHEHQPNIVPGRAFLFVLADEVDPTSRKVVRKVMVNPKLAARYASQLGRPV